MTDRRDPLGKRALYWLPVDERTGVTDAGATGRSGSDGASRVRAGGKHALFSTATPARHPDGAGAVSGSDPLPDRGLLSVACSSCGDVRRVGLVRFVGLHLPVAAWVPGRRFDRWMACPSCGRRTWVSVTLAR